jgi:hypothetical protein
MLGPTGPLIALGLQHVLLQEPVAGWPASAGRAPTLLRPAPALADGARQWHTRRRHLRIGLGVSGGVMLAGGAALGMSLGFSMCGEDSIDCYPIGATVAGVVAAAALISTVVFAVRLTIHNERRPQNTRVQFGPGGLRLHF